MPEIPGGGVASLPLYRPGPSGSMSLIAHTNHQCNVPSARSPSTLVLPAGGGGERELCGLAAQVHRGRDHLCQARQRVRDQRELQHGQGVRSRWDSWQVAALDMTCRRKPLMPCHALWPTTPAAIEGASGKGGHRRRSSISTNVPKPKEAWAATESEQETTLAPRRWLETSTRATTRSARCSFRTCCRGLKCRRWVLTMVGRDFLIKDEAYLANIKPGVPSGLWSLGGEARCMKSITPSQVKFATAGPKSYCGTSGVINDQHYIQNFTNRLREAPEERAYSNFKGHQGSVRVRGPLRFSFEQMSVI
jgi:hypothetical protein